MCQQLPKRQRTLEEGTDQEPQGQSQQGSSGVRVMDVTGAQIFAMELLHVLEEFGPMSIRCLWRTVGVEWNATSNDIEKALRRLKEDREVYYIPGLPQGQWAVSPRAALRHRAFNVSCTREQKTLGTFAEAA